MHTPSPVIYPEVAFASFDLVSYGDIRVPSHALRFGFQVDVLPAQAPTQIVFGLVGKNRNDPAHANPTYGFAVRIDLQNGEIWDMLNDSGMIGWVDEPETLAARFTDETPMLLSWEVDHQGTALIPRLHIGGEEYLYPAIHHCEGTVMETLAGGAGDTGTTSAFIHPAVWRESL